MEEKFRLFLFLGLFIVTLGVAAIGILISYNLNKTYKKAFLQTLLYQQIFLYSFLLYGAWGRIFINRILTGLELSQAILDKAEFIIPAIGLPFLIVSWYMLIRFFYGTKNVAISTKATIAYFLFYTLLITAVAWFATTGTFLKMEASGHLLLKLLTVLNFITNLNILIPVLFFKGKSQGIYCLRFPPGYVAGYLTCVAIYSLGLWFIGLHYMISFFTILLMFSSSALIPVFTSWLIKKLPVEENIDEMDFEAFCVNYEISKREAEIILEICDGKSNKDIADSLFITLQTVKDHTHRIYTKTGVKNRVHLTNLVRKKVKHKKPL